MISAIKWAESGDGLIVRGHNMTEGPSEARLHLHLPFTEAVLARLDESEEDRLIARAEGTISFAARPKQVMTVKFKLDPPD